MKTAAIISEYNPFHQGHAYQIEETKRRTGATHIIALMSGNFVQRGMPAIIDKYRRAEMAVLAGADLVLELPVVFALSSAEYFAEGSIRLLNRLHGVDLLSFGSELGDIQILQEVATAVHAESEEYSDALRAALNLGHSYPRARARALKEVLPRLDAAILDSPNNILAIEYLRALRKTQSQITPFTLKRIGAGYHEEEILEDLGAPTASATAVRKVLHQRGSLKDLVPQPVAAYLETLVADDYPFVSLESVRPYLYYRLLTDGDRLGAIPEGQDGLSQRILNQRNRLRDNTVMAFVDGVKTRRHTHTRITRLLMQFLVGLDGTDLSTLRRTTPDTLKILASSDAGFALMKALRKNNELTLLHNFPRHLDPFQELDIQASEIYGLLCPSFKPQEDFVGFSGGRLPEGTGRF